MDGLELLNAYRQLWFNRSLLVEKDEIETLRDAIKKELKDEMTHPRLRKSPQEKFYMSVKRIIASSLTDNQKTKLIDIHLSVIEEIET